jgi:hypothetical protein
MKNRNNKANQYIQNDQYIYIYNTINIQQSIYIYNTNNRKTTQSINISTYNKINIPLGILACFLLKIIHTSCI